MSDEAMMVGWVSVHHSDTKSVYEDMVTDNSEKLVEIVKKLIGEFIVAGKIGRMTVIVIPQKIKGVKAVNGD